MRTCNIRSEVSRDASTIGMYWPGKSARNSTISRRPVPHRRWSGERLKDSLKKIDTVTHKIFGKGTILEYVEERDSYTIDFNGATRTIRADFFK